MRRRVTVAAFAGFFVMASVFTAAQGGPPGGGESLPSGITALAPSPPAGAPPDAASVARGTVTLRNEAELRALSWTHRSWRAKQFA